MAQYKFSASRLLRFGKKENPSFADWRQLVHGFGDDLGICPELLPFIVKPDSSSSIPYEQLNILPETLSQMTQKVGEMWVLFCFEDSFDKSISAESPLRRDGFVLILEWRKGEPDSPLLATSFHKLAQLVRQQLGVEGWGLWPAENRYKDKVDFTDPYLFADADNADQVASAYGALLAGLYCASSPRYPKAWPKVWPFPSIKWDEEAKRIAGVGGIEKKLAVAADCGAEVVCVVRKQLSEARVPLKDVIAKSRSKRSLQVLPVTSGVSPQSLGRLIARAPGRVGRLVLRACLAGAIPLLCISGYFWDQNREVVELYRSVEDRFGVCVGVDRITSNEARKMPRHYRQIYQGFGLGGRGAGRLLRATSCNGPAGGLMNFKGLGFSVRKYIYGVDGKIEEVEFLNHKLSVVAVQRRSWIATNIVELISLDHPGIWTGLAKEKLQIEYGNDGKLLVQRKFYPTGEYVEIYEENGDKQIREEYFDASGKRLSSIEGAAIVRRKYSESGDEVSKSFFDELDRPICCYRGYHLQTNDYCYGAAMFGVTQILTTYRDTKGWFAEPADGIVMVRTWRDAAGQDIGILFMGPCFDPVEHPSLGVAGFQVNSSLFGNCAERIFFDKYGQVKNSGFGYAKVKSTYDQDNRLMRIRYFDKEDVPTVNEDGVFGLDIKYDSSRNELERVNIGKFGTPVECRDGWAYLLREYDENNQVIRESFRNSQKEALCSLPGLGIVTGCCEWVEVRHDRLNRKVSTYHAKCSKNQLWGANKIEIVSDANNLHSLSFLSDTGSLVDSTLGFATLKILYDAMGDWREISFGDSNEELSLHPFRGWKLQGWAKIIRSVKRTSAYILESVRFVDDNAMIARDSGMGLASGFLSFKLQYSNVGILEEAVSYDRSGEAYCDERLLHNLAFRRFNTWMPIMSRSDEGLAPLNNRKSVSVFLQDSPVLK